MSPATVRFIFRAAGVYGILVLAPLYFLESTLSRLFPPAFSHPDQYYGFIGVALAWQFAFLVIARDPVRHRPFMLPAAAEKLLSSTAAIVLFALGRVPLATVVPAAIDFGLGLVFAVCWLRLREPSPP